MEIAEGQKKGEEKSISCPRYSMSQSAMQRWAPLFLVREWAGTFILHSTKANSAKPRMKTPGAWVSLPSVRHSHLRWASQRKHLATWVWSCGCLSPFWVLWEKIIYIDPKNIFSEHKIALIIDYTSHAFNIQNSPQIKYQLPTIFRG